MGNTPSQHAIPAISAFVAFLEAPHLPRRQRGELPELRGAQVAGGRQRPRGEGLGVSGETDTGESTGGKKQRAPGKVEFQCVHAVGG